MKTLSNWRIDLHRRRRAALLLGSILTSGLSVQAMAQSLPLRLPVDENGVDLATGKIGDLIVPDPAVSVGPEGQGGLGFSRALDQYSYWQNPYEINLYVDGSVATIYFATTQKTFTLSGGVYTSNQGDSSTLVSAGGQNYTYTAADGTVITFGPPASGANIYALSQISPDGRRLDFHYRTDQYCNGSVCYPSSRLQSATDNQGYQIKFGYGTSGLISAMAINNAVDYCDPAADTCTGLTQSWPTLTYSSTQSGGNRVESTTDALGRVTQFTFEYTEADDRLIGVKRPGSSDNDVTISYATDGTYARVSSVAVPGHTTNYNWSLDGSVLTAEASDSAGMVRRTTTNTAQGVVLTAMNGLYQTTSYAYDSAGRLSEVAYPEGNKVQYAYQSATRHNVTQVTRVAKAGSGLSNIMTEVSYDATCSSPAKCNKPNWTRDALGNQTDYTYNSTTGQLLTVTQPAATSGGTRPKATYAYASMQAYFKNSSGSIVASGQPISLLTSTSTCLTSATCSGAAEEAKWIVSYGQQVAGTANNLQPASVTNASGNNGISATTIFSYDAVGNPTSMDGPLTGTGDTTVSVYDALRRQIGVIGPDPDGGGARKNAASRVTFDTKGRVTLTEQGYTAGQTTTAWNAFTPAASAAATYDAADRKLTETLKNGATAYGLTQYSYDARGRLDCTATRMNPAIYGSLPSSACTLGTAGSYGADRITKHTYNAANQVTLVQTAYGTAVQADEQALVYTSNGQVSYVVDANLNRTTYEYDGYDRLVKTRFPVATKGANSSSTSDYEQLTYGDNAHVTTRRLRDGNTIGYAYDNLGRVTALGGPTVADRTFSYNLLGMQTGSMLAIGGQNANNTYDAFGRMTSQVTPQGTVGYQYDTASRRTRITWPDSFYVTYDYDTVGNVTAIRENGATSGIGVLASYSYDDLARRIGVTYGNGTSRAYAYDAVNRTAGIKIDPVGTTSDLTIGAVGGVGSAIAYNPASQITSLMKSNDAYAWTGHYNFNRGYTANGLNQYTASGATAPGYDARGNLTTSGSTTYAYNGLNQLTSVSGGPSATLAYDPADRLYQLTSAGVTTRYLYDGVNMIGEYNGSNALLRRFVPGSGTDEPIVWYEGSGTTDRRWLQADERGSVVSVSDASGNVIVINRYDEYGIPQSTNLGRFQYTGQVWLGEVGLYYYKARFYSPTLGRFMQTDPIGYGDGMNWYNYGGGDPINRADPSGLHSTCFDEDGDRCRYENPDDDDGDGTLNEFEDPSGEYDSLIDVGGNRDDYFPDLDLGPIDLGDLWGGGGSSSDDVTQAPEATPQRKTSWTRWIYRQFVTDPCKGKGTNEGAGTPAGYDPYDVDEGGSLAALYGHVLPDHDFAAPFSDSSFMISAILSTIQTQPTRGSGGSAVYTVNTGQYVGYDAKHGAGSDYLTVVMGPDINGSRTLRTAYPGCR